jgi:hypothetical protein
LIGELRRTNAGISVMVLTATIGPRHLDEILTTGADAVLHKAAPPDHRGGGKVPGWRMSHPQESTSTTGAGFSYQALG